MTAGRTIGIIGSGFGAIACAIELKRAGYDDLRLWERSDDLGGVWRDNTYPGAGCDVPSPLYSFSYAPNPSWSRRYALQPEILAYLRSTADTYGISESVAYGCEVVAATFEESSSRWTVTFADGGSETVDLLVAAVGQLSRPSWPVIEGLADFDGPVFHSAEWDHDVDLTGQRVAVVGTGASAVQLVPHLAEQTSRLVVLQRTPPYVAPKPDRPYGALHRTAFQRLPLTLRAERGVIWWAMEQLARGLDDASVVGRFNAWICRRHLRRQVPDPAMRATLTPDYPAGCKRVLFSNDYLPALARTDVDLVTTGISRVTCDAVVTTDGTAYPVDAIVVSTGFDTQDFLESIDISGPDGVDLAKLWSDGARAYCGIHVPGLPNFFVMYGPNTNLGAGSIIHMLEAQARHVRQALDVLVGDDFAAVSVRADVEEAYDRDLQAQLAHSVWSHCASWYRHESGRITSNWPGGTRAYVRRLRRLDRADFEWTR